MAATAVIPHSPTGEKSYSDEFHTLLNQLSDVDLAALAVVLCAALPPLSRRGYAASRLAQFVRQVEARSHDHLIASLAEFALLFVARGVSRRKGTDQ